MKKSKFSLAFLLLIFSLSNSLSINISSAQNITVSSDEILYGNTLIRIFSENKVGFIDTTGSDVIPAKFANAYDFSEGLAPARINGTFGFINTKGEYVIQPKYDFAEGFRNGIAPVYLDGNAGLLYKNGKEINFENYKLIKFFSATKAFATTHSGKMGIITSDGTLIGDTLCSYIYNFESGFSVAQKWFFDTTDVYNDNLFTSRREYALIDSNGNFIVPLGKYFEIEQPERGFAAVKWFDSDSIFYRGFIDRNGNIVAKSKLNPLTGMNDTVLTSCLNDSLFIVKYSRYDSIINRDNSVSYNVKSHHGIYNLYTDFVIQDTMWKECLIKDENCIMMIEDYNFRKVLFVNNEGKIIIDTNLYESQNSSYEDKEFIILQKNNRYAVYDTGGRMRIPFQSDKIQRRFRNDDKVQFHLYDGKGYRVILDSKLKSIGKVPLKYSEFFAEDNGTVKIITPENFYCYRNGELIYESDINNEEIITMNIDNMKQLEYNPGKIYNNFFKENYKKDYTPNTLSLILDSEQKEIYEKHYTGITLYIANASDKSITVGSSNSVKIKLQAKDKTGNWKYVESRLTGMFCGTGVTNEILNKNDYMKKIIPEFNGDFKTKLRAELVYSDPEDWHKKIAIYSNEIDTRINPAQFWRLIWDFRDYNPYNVY